jgi:hypothetical protein
MRTFSTCYKRTGSKRIADLDVAVEEGRLEVVHACDAFSNVAEYLEDFGFGESVL